MLRSSEAGLASFAIPKILFSPRTSFIGWLALMILLSPVLQSLITLFGAQATLASLYRCNL